MAINEVTRSLIRIILMGSVGGLSFYLLRLTDKFVDQL